MGLGARIFIVHDDDSVLRIPNIQFERLSRRVPNGRFSQYASKRVRYALVIMEMTNRKPQEIIKIDYGYLRFDSEGQLDRDEQEESARLGLEMIPPIRSKLDSGPIVDARHQFARKRYHDEHTWQPKDQLEAEIMRRIFGGQRR
jgi:hypothetical protein